MTDSNGVFQPAGNYYDKYHTRNPLARALMDGFLRSFDELMAQIDRPGSALEIGCGEGEMSIRLAGAGWSVQGCDIAADAVDEARRRVALAGLDVSIERHSIAESADVYSPQDLVVCCEVLEHLEDTQAAIGVLTRLSRSYVLVSVPREPIWRVLNVLRGRYWSELGNTPGHVQHWSRRAFVTELSRHMDVIAVKSPLPWTMALCRVR